MKPLLLIGAALMAGAGIYGFVDYKKTNLKKDFQTLYKEAPKKVVQDVQVPTPPPEEVVPVPTDVPVYTMKNGKVVEEKPAATSKKVAIKPPKKLSKAQFSRAKMDEEYILPLPEDREKHQ